MYLKPRSCQHDTLAKPLSADAARRVYQPLAEQLAAMSRPEKLYARLRELEIEYLQMLRSELQKVADGGDSWFLMIGQGYCRTKTFRKADDQRIQSLDTEIQRLREKLKEPTPDLYKKIDAFVEGAFWLGTTFGTPSV